MTKRKELLASIAKTTKDYREAELASPTPDHIERWIAQFDKDVQLPILSEMGHVLGKTYISRANTKKFLKVVLQSKKLVGDDPCVFWRGVKFLDIQQACLSA